MRRVRFARSAAARVKGLMFQREPSKDEALVIDPARQIHTFGMRFPIDVVFCDREWKIVHVVRNLPPHRITRWVFSARRVVEMPAGLLPGHVEVGQTLELRKSD